MTPIAVLITIAAYFLILFTIHTLQEEKLITKDSLWVTANRLGMW